MKRRQLHTFISYIPWSWSSTKQVLGASLKFIFVLSDETVCNRFHSKLFKTTKVLSWNVSGDLIFAKYTERSKDSCSTDTFAHSLKAGFWMLLFTKHILSTKSYPWMAAPPCRLPYLDFQSHQLYRSSLLCAMVCTSSRAELVTPNLLLFHCWNRVKASGSTPNFDT